MNRAATFGILCEMSANKRFVYEHAPAAMQVMASTAPRSKDAAYRIRAAGMLKSMPALPPAPDLVLSLLQPLLIYLIGFLRVFGLQHVAEDLELPGFRVISKSRAFELVKLLTP